MADRHDRQSSYGWYIVLACMLSKIAGNTLIISTFSLFLHDWSTEFDTPISTFQLGFAGFGIACALISPVVGGMADKWKIRWMFGLGLAGMALASLAISQVDEAWQIVLIYILLLPVAVNFCTNIVSNVIVSRWFTQKLGLALSVTAFGLGLGGILFPPTIAALMSEIGWRAIWQWGAIITAVVILPVVVGLLREKPSSTNTPHDGAQTIGAARIEPDIIGWRVILMRRNFCLLTVAYLPMLGVFAGVGQNIAPIALARGMSDQYAGALISAFSVGQLVALLLAGILYDRFGARLPMFLFSLAVAIGALTMAFGQTPMLLVLGVTLAGVGGGFWPILTAALSAEFGATNLGRAYGLSTLFLPLGTLAPFAIAIIHEASGSYTASLLFIGGLSAAGAVAALMIKEVRRARTDNGSVASVNRVSEVLPR